MGFVVDDGAIRIGRVCCELSDERGWGFDEIYAQPDALGVPTSVHPAVTGAVHCCGVSHVDHVVYTVRELDSAITALSAVLGAPPRRRFHPRGPQGPEMAFYRVGEGFIEVVATGAAPALIGLALWSPDLTARSRRSAPPVVPSVIPNPRFRAGASRVYGRATWTGAWPSWGRDWNQPALCAVSR